MSDQPNQGGWVRRNPDGSHDVFPFHVPFSGDVYTPGAHQGHFPPGYSVFQDPPGTGGGASGGNQIGGNPNSKNTIGTAGQSSGGSTSGKTGSGLAKSTGNSTVGPSTGPEGPPPPEGCDEAMATIVDRGTQTSGEFDIKNTLSQPLIGGMTPLPIYDTADLTGKILFTVESYLEHDPDTGVTQIYHPGSGDGLIVIHPPELDDYHLYGTGVTPNSKWPSLLSQTTLLLMHGGVEGATGLARSKLAFGLPLRTTTSPSDGWIIAEGDTANSSDSNGLLVCPTDTAGDADTASDRYFDVKAVIQGEAWLELPEIATPGVEHSGYGQFYVKTDSLPYFKDDNGTEFPLVTDICGETLVDGFDDPARSVASPDPKAHIIIDDCDVGGKNKATVRSFSAAGVVGGRLALTNNPAAILDDFTAVRDVFYLPFISNEILLNIDAGATPNVYRVCQIVTTSASTGVPSFNTDSLDANRNYDVFAFWDVLTDEVELAVERWGTQFARDFSLTSTRQTGLVLATDHTRRYIGTIRVHTGSNNRLFDNPEDRGLCNYYNMIPRRIQKILSNASHSLNSSTIRQFNASTAYQIDALVGIDGANTLDLEFTCHIVSTGSRMGIVGIGVDSTTTFATDIKTGVGNKLVDLFTDLMYGTQGAELGWHTFSLNQASTGGAVTFVEASVGPPAQQHLLLGGWLQG